MECRWVQGDVDDGGDDGDDGDDDCMFECRWMVICQGLVVLCVCAPSSNSLLAPYYVRIPGIWHAKKPSIYKNKHKYKYNDKQSSHHKHTQHHMAFLIEPIFLFSGSGKSFFEKCLI